MLRIEITEPAGLSRTELRALSTLFLTLAGDVASAAAVTVTGNDVKIAPLDHPSAGADIIGKVETPKTDAEIAKAVFGGNVQSVPGSAVAGPSPTVPAATLDTSTASTAPLPPVPPAVPLAPTVAHPAPPVPPVPGVELDADGFPWDGRIHSSTKAKIKSGQWKIKRGVDDSVIKSVEAELRAVLGTSAPDPMAQFKTAAQLGIVPPPPPPADIATGPGTFTASPSSAPAIVPPPPPPSAPTAAAIAAGMTFPQFCGRVTNALTTKELTQEQVAAALGKHGLAGLPTLAPFPHLVPKVAAELGFV